METVEVDLKRAESDPAYAEAKLKELAALVARLEQVYDESFGS